MRLTNLLLKAAQQTEVRKRSMWRDWRVPAYTIGFFIPAWFFWYFRDLEAKKKAQEEFDKARDTWYKDAIAKSDEK